MTKLEIYPEVPRPSWLCTGIKVFVAGEASDEFTVSTISHLAAFLVNNTGRGHGWESFCKLSLVCEVMMTCIVCGKEEVIKLPNGEIDKKQLPTGWNNYSYDSYWCNDCVVANSFGC